MKAVPSERGFKVGSRQDHCLYMTHLVMPEAGGESLHEELNRKVQCKGRAWC